MNWRTLQPTSSLSWCVSHVLRSVHHWLASCTPVLWLFLHTLCLSLIYIYIYMMMMMMMMMMYVFFTYLYICYFFSLFIHMFLYVCNFYFHFTLRCLYEFCLKYFRKIGCENLSCHELSSCKVFQEFVLGLDFFVIQQVIMSLVF